MTKEKTTPQSQLAGLGGGGSRLKTKIYNVVVVDVEGF